MRHALDYLFGSKYGDTRHVHVLDHVTEHAVEAMPAKTVVFRGKWGDRHAVQTHDRGRDPLAKAAGGRRVQQQNDLGVRMRVNETGRDAHVVAAMRRLGTFERAHLLWVGGTKQSPHCSPNPRFNTLTALHHARYIPRAPLLASPVRLPTDKPLSVASLAVCR